MFLGLISFIQGRPLSEIDAEVEVCQVEENDGFEGPGSNVGVAQEVHPRHQSFLV